MADIQSTAEMVNLLRDKTIFTRFNVLETEIFLERLDELGLAISPKDNTATSVKPEAWVTTAPSSAPPSDQVPSPEVTGGVQADDKNLVTPAEVAVHPEMAHNLAPAMEGKLAKADPAKMDDNIGMVDNGMKIEGPTPIAEPAPLPLKQQDGGTLDPATLAPAPADKSIADQQKAQAAADKPKPDAPKDQSQPIKPVSDPKPVPPPAAAPKPATPSNG